MEMPYVPDTELVLQTNPLHSPEINVLEENSCDRVEDPQRLESTSCQGGAPSAHGTILYIEEEGINRPQSAVDDDIILA